MAINWNQAEFVAPKIQINPEALPIEAMMNVGDELQKRYDVALDTDTKLGAVARNLLQNVADIDKPEAMKIFDFYQNRLKERASKGNYQDMRFQTQADALDLKGMYEGLSNRKKELEDYEKSLRERKDISATKAQELLEMEKAKLSSAIFDPERRYVSNLGISKRHFASDVEPLELGNTMLSGWKADSHTGKSQSFKMADGTTEIKGLGILPKGTILEYKEGHGWEQVKPEDIGKATEQMFKSHIGFNAMVDRDTELSIYKEPLKEGETLESRRQQVFNQLTNNTKEFLKDKFGYKQTQDETEVNFSKGLAGKEGDGDQSKTGKWTQISSVKFDYQSGKEPFKINEKTGEIIGDTQQLHNELLLGNPNISNDDFKKVMKEAQNSTESTEYKRVKNYLVSLGEVKENSSKKDVNKAIVDFWNGKLIAQSTIVVPEAGDKVANDIVEQKNRTYFGVTDPNAQVKGTSIRTGQLANRPLTNERGVLLTPQDAYNEVKNKNVRVIGFVGDWHSPFEVRSDAMVATDPNTGNTSHYFIEPDLNTKNTGTYFANRIINSKNKKSLVSDWRDGLGNSYEATYDGKSGNYIVYVNKDIKTPIVLSEKDLDVLASNSDPSDSQYFMQVYYNKKNNGR